MDADGDIDLLTANAGAATVSIPFKRATCWGALAPPPAPAVQYRATFDAARGAALEARAVRLREELTDRIRTDDRPGGLLDPTAFALDQLRLGLLDAEAATLRAWLAEGA